MDDVLMRSKEEAKEQEAKKAYSRPEKSLKNHGFSEMSKKVQRGKGDRCSRDHL
jgi:N-acetylglutamate synthase-like GNAT family acetyltransferase